MSGLLPCPWCGGQVVESVSEGSTFRWRKFDGCCADGPEVRHNTTADDQAAAEVESRAKAIAAWNERVTPPAAAPDEAMVDRAKAAYASAVLSYDWSDISGPTSHEVGLRAALTAALTGAAPVAGQEVLAWMYPSDTAKGFDALHRLYGKADDPLARRIPSGGIPVFAPALAVATPSTGTAPGEA